MIFDLIVYQGESALYGFYLTFSAAKTAVTKRYSGFEGSFTPPERNIFSFFLFFFQFNSFGSENPYYI